MLLLGYWNDRHHADCGKHCLGCLVLLLLYRWAGWDHRECFILEISFLSFPRKYIGISSLRTVLNFQLSFYFQTVSHLHIWSSPFSSTWCHNTTSTYYLILMSSPKNLALLLTCLLTAERIKDWRCCAINSEPSTPLDFYFISIHYICSLHTVVSRTHYHFFTDLHFSGAYHYVCCRISSCIYMRPGFWRISCGIFCMWNQINGQIPCILYQSTLFQKRATMPFRAKVLPH